MNTTSAGKTKTKRYSYFKHFCALFLILFLFWTTLSGKLDVKHLTIGAVTSLVVAWVTLSLLRLPSGENKDDYYLAFDIPIRRLLAYVPWLIWEVVKANVHVALIVLNPKMPIEPKMFKFTKKMDSPVAQVLLANSITLTPGTITVDLQDNVYIVHALDEDSEKALTPDEGEAVMPEKVARLFQENVVGGRGD